MTQDRNAGNAPAHEMDKLLFIIVIFSVKEEGEERDP
jgi:hypothetical protein